jgi:hypothetical protein
MKFALFSASLALAAVSASGNALMAPAVDVKAPEHLPTAAIVKLVAEPAKVELRGRYASTQLLITAQCADGSTADVTRLAKFSAAQGIASISKNGMMAPLKGGEDTLRVEAGGQTLSVPVQVTGLDRTPTPDFIRDVNPVMTKLGCNAGTCHGAKDGKVGFKLSLRGYDPLYDVRALKDDLAGRRLNVASPDDSLMLLKSTAGVPHEGGQRTKLGEKYYDIMRSWIADGAKLDVNAARVAKIQVFPINPVVQEIGAQQQTRVVATYTDGSTRDVTAEAFLDSGNTDVATTDPTGLVRTLRRGEAPLLARYEGNYAATTVTVMGNRDGFVWKEPESWGRIDELVAAKWQRMKIVPSDLCTDEEFLRRVYLDLTGLPPSPDEVRAFVADTQPPRAKREAMVDKLVGTPDFVDHWTNKWADLLELNSKYIAKEGVDAFRAWIRKEVESNTPYDQFVRKLITATGSTRENPAANYWKILRQPDDLLENTSHLFLATRFNCNKCHDHPFERWTQDQYYTFGAYFAQVQRLKDPESGAREIKGTAVEKSVALWEIIGDAKAGEMIHLRTNKPAPPKFPYEAGAVAEKPGETRRQELADWLTSPDNRYFASSYANRIWGYMTGVGIIEPLDDIRAGNPPTNPELLEYLTKEFTSHQFDVRHLMKIVCKSRTYGLSIKTNQWNADDKINYSHATARRLPAEVLYDSVVRVTGSKSGLPGAGAAGKLSDSATDLPSGFLAALGRPARESACECERNSDLRLGSVMSLLSGPAVAEAIGDPKSSLAALAAKETDEKKLIDEIFLRVLSRPATEAEINKTAEAWKKITKEDEQLQKEWAAKEAEQAPIIAKAEADRVAAIAAAKAELERYDTEIAPRVAAAEAARVKLEAKNKEAVEKFQAEKAPLALAAWESALPAERKTTGWYVFDKEIKNVTASGGAKLERLKNGVIVNRGPVTGASDYGVNVDTTETGITGILLEVIPDATLPKLGPGLQTDGNFILTEITLDAQPKGAPGTKPTAFSAAVADFNQEKFDVKSAIDTKTAANDAGWAISGGISQRHLAAFTLSKPVGEAKGALLKIQLLQRRNPFLIGQFRLWYTKDKTVGLGLPAEVLTVLSTPAADRTEAQTAALAAYFRESDPESIKLDLAYGASKQPLPTDPGTLQRRAALAKAEEPIRLDPKLVQLRQDSQHSKAQAADQRLTGAQDLVWALVNNPAFLFNH